MQIVFFKVNFFINLNVAIKSQECKGLLQVSRKKVKTLKFYSVVNFFYCFLHFIITEGLLSALIRMSLLTPSPMKASGYTLNISMRPSDNFGEMAFSMTREWSWQEKKIKDNQGGRAVKFTIHSGTSWNLDRAEKSSNFQQHRLCPILGLCPLLTELPRCDHHP